MSSLTTLTRLTLQEEVNGFFHDLVQKDAKVDHFSAREQELHVQAAFYDRWNAQVQKALTDIAQLGKGRFTTFVWRPNPDEVMKVLNSHLSGSAFTDGLNATLAAPIGDSFNKGRASVNAMFEKQTGRQPMKKDFFGLAQITGLTEDTALQALLEQTIQSSYSFWDDQLSSSIQREIELFFQGAESRDDLISSIEQLVKAKIGAGDAGSLPTTYFENLATNQIVRARNIGSYYRGKTLGAVHYTLVNPNDNRTSPICSKVTQGQIYSMAGAEQTITGIITANSVDELKAAAPFYKDAGDVVNPVPPLHWPKCRTRMNFVFEGL